MTSRGFALVAVLWVALVMGLLVAGVADIGARRAESAALARHQIASHAIADLALHRAVWVIKTGGTADLRADGLVWTGTLDGGRFALRIDAADALVDLNAASDAVLSDLAAAIARRLDAPDADAILRDRLVALRGRASDPLAIGNILADLAPDRADVLAVAGLVTVGSGRTAPSLAAAPEAILRDVAGFSGAETDTLLRARRDGAPILPDLPEAYAAPVFASDLRPRGPVWHVSVAASAADADIRAGEVWVIYLPLPETRPTRAFHVMARWPLWVDDPVLVALDDPEQGDDADR